MDKALWDKGLAARKKTLGAEYVDKSLSTVDDFNREWQEIVTAYCWGRCGATTPSPPRPAR